MERRLLYAIALMIGIMILSNVIFPPVERPLEPGIPGTRRPRARKPPAGGEEPEPSGAERAAEEMAAALAEPEEMEVPGQEEAPAPRAGETVIVRSDLFEYRFDTRGARLVGATMLEYENFASGGHLGANGS